MKSKILASILVFASFQVIAEEDKTDIRYPNEYIKYQCKNKLTYNLQIEFDNNNDRILVSQKNIEPFYVPSALSADGARYYSDKGEFWFKGDKLTINGKTKCKEI